MTVLGLVNDALFKLNILLKDKILLKGTFPYGYYKQVVTPAVTKP